MLKADTALSFGERMVFGAALPTRCIKRHIRLATPVGCERFCSEFGRKET
jgi:hypothetical protein